MSLIVETGSGLPNAESYTSVADADAYFIARGSTEWTAILPTTAAKEIALRLATQAIEVWFVGRWLGTRINQTMSLSWPRYSVYEDDGYSVSSSAVPQRIKDATCELALRQVQGDSLIADLSEPGSIAGESVTVGPISVATQYAGGKSQEKQYSIVDGLVSPYITSGCSLVRS